MPIANAISEEARAAYGETTGNTGPFWPRNYNGQMQLVSFQASTTDAEGAPIQFSWRTDPNDPTVRESVDGFRIGIELGLTDDDSILQGDDPYRSIYTSILLPLEATPAFIASLPNASAKKGGPGNAQWRVKNGMEELHNFLALAFGYEAGTPLEDFVQLVDELEQAVAAEGYEAAPVIYTGIARRDGDFNKLQLKGATATLTAD